MFSKFLGRKNAPYKEIEAPALAMTFLREPTGNGLGVLKEELSRILASEGNTSKAYLRLVQYQSEDRPRIALVIDGTEPAEAMASSIARGCQGFVDIDLLFFESLTSSLIQDVQLGAVPFYVAAGA